MLVCHNAYSDHFKKRWSLLLAIEIKTSNCIIFLLSDSKNTDALSLQGPYWFSVLYILYVFIKYT